MAFETHVQPSPVAYVSRGEHFFFLVRKSCVFLLSDWFSPGSSQSNETTLRLSFLCELCHLFGCHGQVSNELLDILGEITLKCTSLR